MLNYRRVNKLSVTFFSQLWGCACDGVKLEEPPEEFSTGRPSGMPRTSQSGYPLVNSSDSYHSAKSTSISSGHVHCSHAILPEATQVYDDLDLPSPKLE